MAVPHRVTALHGRVQLGTATLLDVTTEPGHPSTALDPLQSASRRRIRRVSTACLDKP